MVFSPAHSSLRNSPRGQTSLETLLIVAFILTLTTLISLSFFENHTKTNVAANAKILVLPYVERNTYPLHISTILPVLSSGANASLQLSVFTRGQIDVGIVSQATCDAICPRLDPANYFSGGVTFTWGNIQGSAPPVEVCQSTC